MVVSNLHRKGGGTPYTGKGENRTRRPPDEKKRRKQKTARAQKKENVFIP